ncbi:MAG: cellulose synthase, partial [Methylorubrum extorquens]
MSAMAVRPLPRAGLGPARRAARAPALALFCALMGGVPVHAQSFLGTGPAERLTVPPTGDALRKQSPAPAQAPARAPTSSAPPTPTAQGRPSAPDSADGG